MVLSESFYFTAVWLGVGESLTIDLFFSSVQ